VNERVELVPDHSSRQAVQAAQQKRWPEKMNHLHHNSAAFPSSSVEPWTRFLGGASGDAASSVGLLLPLWAETTKNRSPKAS
jgi:hypothetical protein